MPTTRTEPNSTSVRSRIIANTGTYLDSPFHRFADGMDISELSLRSLASLDGILVRIPEGHGRAIGPNVLAGIEVGGRAVLVHTGWDRHGAPTSISKATRF